MDLLASFVLSCSQLQGLAKTIDNRLKLTNKQKIELVRMVKETSKCRIKL